MLHILLIGASVTFQTSRYRDCLHVAYGTQFQNNLYTTTKCLITMATEFKFDANKSFIYDNFGFVDVCVSV